MLFVVCCLLSRLWIWRFFCCLFDADLIVILWCVLGIQHTTQISVHTHTLSLSFLSYLSPFLSFYSFFTVSVLVFFVIEIFFDFILCALVMLVVDIVKTIDEDLKSIISGLEKTQKEFIENDEPPRDMILVLNKVLSLTHSFFPHSYNRFLFPFFVFVDISTCNKLTCCSWTWQRKTETKTAHLNAMSFTSQTFKSFSVKYF
jgi:hypothetical protein